MLWSVLTTGEKGNTLIQRKAIVFLNRTSPYHVFVFLFFFFLFAIKLVGIVTEQVAAVTS